MNYSKYDLDLYVTFIVWFIKKKSLKNIECVIEPDVKFK